MPDAPSVLQLRVKLVRREQHPETLGVPHGELRLPAGLVGQRQDVSGARGGVTGLFRDILDIALAETVKLRARRSCGKVIVPWLRLPG